VHGSYVRQVRDLPLGGRPVLIHLAMRRFSCQNRACKKVTFAGQADGLTARYQRWSVPLARLLSQIALELAGRAGMRLARALGVAVHRGALLRLVIDLPGPTSSSAPQVLGVDDFALRRGHVYATVLVDAASGQAIDILPGREAGPLAGWLKAHPGARVICRDRAGAYAEGARDGAPAAVQVADRWHLWHNLAEHTAKAVARHRACLRQVAAAAEQAQPPPEPAMTTAPASESRLEVRMRDQHAAVQALAARGLGLRAIARDLGIDRKTARRFAYAATGDDAAARAISRPTVLDRYQPHLHRRWNEGCHDAAVLHAEVTALGYRGSMRTIYRYLQPLRDGTAPAARTPPRLKIGEVTSWLLRRAEDLNPRQQQLLAELRGHCAQLDRLAGHVTSFAKMMTKRTGDQELAGWVERVEADDQPELHTYAAGIRLDLAAVTAGLTLPYSSGAAEGNVNRLKAIKRQMQPRQPRPAAQTRHPPPTVTPVTKFAPEPIKLASDRDRACLPVPVRPAGEFWPAPHGRTGPPLSRFPRPPSDAAAVADTDDSRARRHPRAPNLWLPDPFPRDQRKLATLP
jgi:transposase